MKNEVVYYPSASLDKLDRLKMRLCETLDGYSGELSGCVNSIVDELRFRNLPITEENVRDCAKMIVNYLPLWALSRASDYSTTTSDTEDFFETIEGFVGYAVKVIMEAIKED